MTEALLFFDLSRSSDDFHGQIAEFHGGRFRLEKPKMSSRGRTGSHPNGLSDRRNKLLLCIDEIYSDRDSVLDGVRVDSAHVSALCKLTKIVLIAVLSCLI